MSARDLSGGFVLVAVMAVVLAGRALGGEGPPDWRQAAEQCMGEMVELKGLIEPLKRWADADCHEAWDVPWQNGPLRAVGLVCLYDPEAPPPDTAGVAGSGFLPPGAFDAPLLGAILGPSIAAPQDPSSQSSSTRHRAARPSRERGT